MRRTRQPNYEKTHLTAQKSRPSRAFLIISLISSRIFTVLALNLLFIFAVYHHLTTSRPECRRASTARLEKFTKGDDHLSFDPKYYIRLANLECNVYDVPTPDGHVLRMIRLRFPEENGMSRRGKKPILLLHGLLQSSMAYCTSGSNSLAFYFMKEGFDVWMGENRCGFDHKHVSESNPWSYDLWDWDLNDMATLDLPSMINRILEQSSHKCLTLIAHSQGTTQAFTTLSRYGVPGIHRKLNAFIALSPAAYTGPLLQRWYLKLPRRLGPAAYSLMFGTTSFFGIMIALRRILPKIVFTALGYVMFSYLFGWDDQLWDSRYRNRQFLFAPVFVSAKLMYWWLGPNGFTSKGVALDEASPWFTEKLPPMFLVVPGRDNLVDPYKLINRLTAYEKDQVCSLVIHEIPEYSHLDVLWAKDCIARVGKPIVEFLASKSD